MDEKEYQRRLYEIRLKFLKLAGFFVLTMPVVICVGNYACAVAGVSAPDFELFLKACFGGIGGMLVVGFPLLPQLIPNKQLPPPKDEEKK